MSNTINWGKIYEKTAWGIGVVTNTISWGKIYANLAGSIPSFALDFATISDDFTFTRSSFATRVNEFGLIETVTDLGSELVQNGDFEELGSELVTNGSFDTDSDWSLTNGATISNGQLNIDYNLGNGSTTQTNVFTIGKTYKIEINVDNSSVGVVRINNGVSPTVLSNGLNTFYLEAVGTAIEIRNHVNFVGSIDNISIKQVDPNDEWSLGASWSIEDGKAISDGSQTGNSLLQQASILTLNKLYKVSYDLTVDSGTIYVRLGFSGQGAVRATSGSYTEYVTCSGNTNFDFLATSTYSGSVDNVSIQEVLEDDVPRIDYSDATFDVPVLGNELVTNGDFDTDSDWTKVNSTISDGKGNLDSTSSTSLLFQPNVLTVGKTYKANFDVSNYNGLGTCALINSSGAIQFEITSDGNKDFYFTHGGSAENLNFRAVSGGIFSIDNVSVKEVTAYTTTDKGSFLLEPQSTNLLPYSEDFSQWNAISNPTVTLNQAISPDGTNNATLLEFDQTVTTSRIEVSIPSGGGGDWVFSIWAKSVSGNDVSFGMEIGSAGTLEQERVATSEWKRFYIVGTTTSSVNLYPQIEAWTTNNESIYIWGGQLEALPYATSYIPTNGSAVTRSAELCVDATPTINSEEGVLYFEGSALFNAIQNRYIGISDGTTSNRVQVIFSSSLNRLSVGGGKGGVGLGSINYNSYIQTDNNKIAFVYSASGVKLFVNGVERGSIVADASFSEGTLTHLDFSLWNSVTSPFYGNTKDLKIYDRALTDEELLQLTTI